MITRIGPDRFTVEFQKARRGRWFELGRSRVTVVDGYAVAQAVLLAMRECEDLSADKRPEVWNDYTLFLARADHDRLRPREASLHQKLGTMLYEEFVRLEAVTVGDFVVRLRVDEGADVPEGQGVLWVRWVPGPAPEPADAAELTIRLDRINAGAPMPEPTTRHGSAVVRAPVATFPLVEGTRHSVGRAHPGAGPEHLGVVPAVETRVGRRQAWLRLVDGQLEVGREDSNGVSVNGQPLQPGERVVVPLPAEIGLTNNQYRLVVEPC